MNENLEEKINLQKVEHNLSLQRKTEEIEKEKEERVKEAYEKGVADSQNQVRILLKYLRNKYETWENVIRGVCMTLSTIYDGVFWENS